MLRLDALGRLVQISFNNYDRAPLWLPPGEMAAFYEAYTVLHRLIVDPAHRIERRFQGGYFRAARSVLEQ